MALPRVSAILGASQAKVSTSWLCRWLGGCAVVAVATLGCGRGDGVAFAPVEGRVTLDGQPLEAGEIRFQPDTSQGNKAPLSAAVLGAGGSFKLRGPGTRVGAVAGPHRVYFVSPFKNDVPEPPKVCLPGGGCRGSARALPAAEQLAGAAEVSGGGDLRAHRNGHQGEGQRHRIQSGVQRSPEITDPGNDRVIHPCDALISSASLLKKGFCHGMLLFSSSPSGRTAGVHAR